MKQPKTKQTTINPLAGYVLVEPVKAEANTPSGIILPDSAKEQQARGVVIALGEYTNPTIRYIDAELDTFNELSAKRNTPPVNMGDVVIFKKWGGDDIKVKDREYKLVKYEDLMATINNYD